MKYYLIAGEASGDLHASRLMQSLKRHDPEAQFRFFGGDMMAAVAGPPVRHYRDLAYMGLVPVLLHLPTILKNMKMCKQDIAQWQPHAVILVDYPGFNLDIAKYVHRLHHPSPITHHPSSPNTHHPSPNTQHPKVFYYISPKIWAWKEGRIRRIKRDVDELFSILPFEVDFFEKKHHFPIHYVGNPTKEEVDEFLSRREERGERREERGERQGASPFGEVGGALLLLLPGSRRQEIKDNLPAMIEATKEYARQYDVVVGGAPGIDEDYYQSFIKGSHVRVAFGQTYQLLSRSVAALVTSGTATLETALFRVPQVVCYRAPMAWFYGFLRRLLVKVQWVSLVNLVAQREVVPELVVDTFSLEELKRQLARILPGGEGREAMLQGYDEVRRRLGDRCAPDEAARLMTEKLKDDSAPRTSHLANH